MHRLVSQIATARDARHVFVLRDATVLPKICLRVHLAAIVPVAVFPYEYLPIFVVLRGKTGENSGSTVVFDNLLEVDG